MPIHRVVPDLASTSPSAAAAFYERIFGFVTVMDQGWIVTLADPERPSVQLSVISSDAGAIEPPDVSIEVSDVDAVHESAVAAGVEIVYALVDEPWGVRRFFLRDLDGHVVNVLSH